MHSPSSLHTHLRRTQAPLTLAHTRPEPETLRLWSQPGSCWGRPYGAEEPPGGAQMWCGTSTGRKLGKSVILPEVHENSPGGGPARMPSAQSLQPTQNILIVLQWNVERVILSGINNTTKCCTKVEVRFSQKLMQKWSYITAKWVAKITHSKTWGFWNCR